MNAPSTVPAATLGVLICHTRNELVQYLERTLAAAGFDVNFTQYLALKRLASDGPMSASELARALKHDGGALSRMLDRLSAKGYLRRTPDPRDRRALRIELTEAGQAASIQMREHGRGALQAALGGIDDAERAQLASALERIMTTLQHLNS